MVTIRGLAGRDNEHFIDSPPIHIDHFKTDILPFKVLASDRNSLYLP